jgi:hypothetical protein
MNAPDFSELDEADKRHFYKCKQCGEMVDMRQLDDVLFHEDHVHRAESITDISCCEVSMTTEAASFGQSLLML